MSDLDLRFSEKNRIRIEEAIIVITTRNFFCRFLINTVILIQNLEQFRTDIENGR